MAKVLPLRLSAVLHAVALTAMLYYLVSHLNINQHQAIHPRGLLSEMIELR